MNPEMITKVIETIKTMNINVNDATTQKVADALLPIVRLYIIKDFIGMFLGFLATCAACYTFYRIAKLIFDFQRERDK